MNSKFFTIATVVSTSILIAQVSQAQTDKEPIDIQTLCSKFPNNSKCEEIKAPVSLESRDGVQSICNFKFDPGVLEQNKGCKVKFKNDGITVYQEAGRKLEQFDDRRTTIEVNIPRDRIFITNYQVWSAIARWKVGFVTEAIDKQPVQTNFLTVIVGGDRSENFALQAKALEASKPEILKPILTQSINDSPNIQQLLKTKECQYCDLNNADLSDAELEGANLVGANLEGANLQGAKLEGAYLLGANLKKADLTEANFQRANLTFANLAKSIAFKTEFQGVNLQAANLEQADLAEVKLTVPALLEQANLTRVSLIDADLQGANFTRANLQQADLSGANLNQTGIEPKDILRNDDAGVKLLNIMSAIGAGLSGAALEYNLAILGSNKEIDAPTYFSGANLRGANLTNTSLKQVFFYGANLTNVDFTESSLELEQLEQLEEQGGAQLCGLTLADGSASDRNCDK